MDADEQGEPFARDAEEQAILWAIAWREDSDDPLLAARFQAWLDADPAHRRLWDETYHVYHRLGDVEPAYAVRGRQAGTPWPAATAVSPSPVETPVQSRPWRRAALLSAGTMCLALLLAPSAMLRLRADHRTGTAEMRTVRLADGSVVQMAPQSAIAVDYDGGRRDVRLLRGEAFFSVTRNPHRPFRVIGEQASVTVLGTAFDVREADGPGQAAFIGVEHGRVRVAPTTGRAGILTGGQAATIGLGGALRRQAMPPAQVAAWRGRQLIVQDEPITSAIDRLRPWFGGVILTRGDGLSQQRLTGVFNTSDPVEALTGMARAHGGRVTVIGGWMILYSQD